MVFNSIEKFERKTGKKLYDYQHDAIDQIFDQIEKPDEKVNLLYQLPTGGGKTVIFSEFARRYINDTRKKVLILTHRVELCGQTSRMLDEFGVPNKIIDSKVKELPDQDEYACFVAMVETLSNRIQDSRINLRQLGLVIIDEAHYNSFRKLFKYFSHCNILGVTATPLSSNLKLPMKDNYDSLIVGQSISELVRNKFLAKANTYSYNVNLKSLSVGVNGDYTVASSERLYSNYEMQEKLLQAYEERSKGKKTLIFNNGIQTSRNVAITFESAGYDIRHLDNTNSEKERKEILQWFKETPNAILTSVSILTTGFDEPTVETIILNRATKSLTLYHQMIGRGSRYLPNKDEFTVLDLGNNALRFGLWDSYIDWKEIFSAPLSYINNLSSDEELQRNFKYEMPKIIRDRFPNTKDEDMEFDVKEEYKQAVREALRAKEVLNRSHDQHAKTIIENSEDLGDALELVELLSDEIKYRIKAYSYCITSNSENFVQWLEEEYLRKLKTTVRQHQFVDLEEA